jgi:ammonia channel protein AmtB
MRVRSIADFVAIITAQWYGWGFTLCFGGGNSFIGGGAFLGNSLKGFFIWRLFR